MTLSVYSDYALRVLMHAALRAPESVTIDDVSDAYGISRHHVSKIVHELALKGFLATRRGIGGGFTLAQKANDISVGQILRLTETDENVINCMSRKNEPCAIFPACRLRGALAEATQAFFAVLDEYSLDDLTKRNKGMKDLLRINSGG